VVASAPNVNVSRSTPRRRAARGFAIALALVGAGAGARPVGAGAEPPPDPRANALRVRVAEWYEARKGLIREKCPKCAGFGGGSTTNKVWVNCPRCEGRKTVLATRPYRKVFFDMRSPAFRAREKAQEEVTAAYTRIDRADATPVQLLSTFRIDRVEIDGAGGTAYVFENVATVARESH